jgi:hypothetical protein
MRDVVDGAFAIANDTHVMLAGGCHPDANRLVLLRLEEKSAVPVDEVHLATPGAKINRLVANYPGTLMAFAASCVLLWPVLNDGIPLRTTLW